MHDDEQTPILPELPELPDDPSGALVTLAGAEQVIDTAIAYGLAAGSPTHVGDVGRAFVVPDGYRVETLDVRTFEVDPRVPSFRSGSVDLVGVKSFAEHVARYHDPASTVIYVHDMYGSGARMMTQDTPVVRVVFDDHPMNTDDGPRGVGRRAHTARMILRPTAAARRWGRVLSGDLTQDAFLDLVQDGIGEIADPAGATLRDLVSDLHAIRSTDIKSVKRTGGEGLIEVAENVKLHAGTGNAVTFPETMRVVLFPFAGIPEPIALEIRIAPKLRDNRVVFGFACAELEDRLAQVIGSIADEITERTGYACQWVPG